MKTRLLICLCAAFILTGCSRGPEGKRTAPVFTLEQALEAAGGNRAELERALTHFSGEPEKLEAAEFLIRNMPYAFWFSGEGTDIYNRTADSLFLLAEPLHFDSLTAALDATMINVRDKIAISRDLQHIGADSLIEAVESAFALREKYPWTARLSKDEFFEYILPYRLTNEQREQWRTVYQAHLGPAVDSIVAAGGTDSTVCAYLLSRYIKVPKLCYPPYSLPYAPSTLLHFEAGDCNAFMNLSVFATRAFGIPSTFDFIPNWASGPGNHRWGVIFPPEGGFIPYLMGDDTLIGDHWRNLGDFAKVYRHTSSVQSRGLELRRLTEHPPVNLREVDYIDVTHLYVEVADVSVPLNFASAANEKVAYIMVFDGEAWVPVDWARTDMKQARFKNMGRNKLYIVAYGRDGDYRFASSPFYIDSEGETRIKVPRNEVIVDSRVTWRPDPPIFAENMIGGIFEAANMPDFSDAVALHTITELPDARYHEVKLDRSGSYRYFRYVSPENGYGNVAEIKVIGSDGEELTGEITGSGSDLIDIASQRRNVFDGDPLTFFDAPLHYGIWFGLDMGVQKNISAISYYPRNARPAHGDRFLMLCWERDRWLEIGEQTWNADREYLQFGLPENGLYRLINLTRNKADRPFVLEKGNQKWV